MERIKCAISAAVFLVAVSSDGHAQNNDLPGELAHCLSFSGAVERLSCYDRLARGAANAGSHVSTLPPLPAQARAAASVPPEKFGKEELPGGATVPEQDRMTAEISDFRKDQAGRFTVELSNGQIWQQVAGDTTAAQYRSGKNQSVTISRGSLGSYDLRFSGRNVTFKVRRLR
jgi:hypothetical protein